MRAFWLLLLFAFCGAISFPAFAQNEDETPVAVAPAAPIIAPRLMARTVRVADDKGAPVADAKITLRIFGPDSKPQTGTTDAEGVWKFEAQSDATFRIGATAAGRVPGGSYQAPAREGGAARAAFAIVLHDAKPISVRLIDDKGAPVANAQLTLARRGKSRMSAQTSFWSGDEDDDSFSARSDAEGRATLPFGSEGDDIWVRVQSAKFQTFEARLEVPEDDGLTLRFAPGATVRGRVVRADGTPIAGMMMSLPGLSGSARSGEDGRFEMTGLDEGRDYPFAAMKPSDPLGLIAALRAVETRRGQTTDAGDIVLTPGGLVQGTVEIVAGKSNGLRDVRITSIEKDDALQAFESGVRFAQGRFEKRLAPGRYEITAERYLNTGRNRATQIVEVTEGGTVAVALKWEAIPVRAPRFEDDDDAPVETKATEKATPGLIAGRVVGKDGKAAPGATVIITSKGGAAQTVKVDAEGRFSIDTGPPVTGESSTLSAKSGTQTSETIRIVGGRSGIVLPLQDEGVLRIQAVDGEGNVVLGATAAPAVIVFPAARGSREKNDAIVAEFLPDLARPFDASLKPAAIRGLPNGVFLHVDVTAPGYASYRHIVALPRRGVVELPISRETVIKGRVMMGDRPFSAPGLIMKTQTWNYSNYWWSSEIAADGSFAIRKVPSLEQVRETWLGLNIHANNLGQNGPNVRSQWIHGWDLLLTVKNGARTEWWLAPVEMQQEGLVFKEGETVQHDFKLRALGKISGVVPGPNNANVRVSYSAKGNSMYGDWSAQTDKAGRFTLYAQADSPVVLRWPGGTQEITGIKAHEELEVELKAGSNAPARVASDEPLEWTVRVVGPDGATIPRPPLRWQRGTQTWGKGSTVPGEAPAFSTSSMDGTLSMYEWNEGAPVAAPLQFSSDYMDAPVEVTPVPGRIVRLKFDRVPPATPPVVAWSAAMRRRMDREAPAALPAVDATIPQRLNIGDAVPDWKQLTFTRGAEQVAQWKNRVVLVHFGAAERDTWIGATLKRFPSLLSLQIVPADESVNADTHFTAVARDAKLANGRGYNATLLDQSYGSILIADGKLAAVGLGGPLLEAKIDQLLERAESTQ